MRRAAVKVNPSGCRPGWNTVEQRPSLGGPAAGRPLSTLNAPAPALAPPKIEGQEEHRQVDVHIAR